MDNCYFERGVSAVGWNNSIVSSNATGPVYGVVDHCTFHNMQNPCEAFDNRSTDAADHAFLLTQPGYIGSRNGVPYSLDSNEGASAWREFLANPRSFLGSNKMMFYEDCNFSWDPGQAAAINWQGISDGGRGGMLTMRHCTATGADQFIHGHGPNPSHGVIFQDLYNNTYDSENLNISGGAIGGPRGGAILFHDNDINHNIWNGTLTLTLYWLKDPAAECIKNSYYWNNRADGVAVNGISVKGGNGMSADTPGAQAGDTTARTYIREGFEYFRNAPPATQTAGQDFYSYTPYTYPHPLTVPLELESAVSRKTHGTAGAFDVNLPLSGEPGVECRSGGAGGDHILVFTFNKDIVSGSASVTTGTGSVSGSPTFSGHTMTVNLTGVTDVQKITVTLSGVTDSDGQVAANTPVDVNMLIGDVTGNKAVNGTDVSTVQSQSGQSVTSANFRLDVVVNGQINNTDKSQVQVKSGNGLP